MTIETEIFPATKEDLKGVTKKASWKFDWKGEAKLNDRNVYKLTIQGNRNIIQALMSISDYEDHIFMHLIESAPFNFGKPKLYEGFRVTWLRMLAKYHVTRDIKDL